MLAITRGTGQFHDGTGRTLERAHEEGFSAVQSIAPLIETSEVRTGSFTMTNLEPGTTIIVGVAIEPDGAVLMTFLRKHFTG